MTRYLYCLCLGVVMEEEVEYKGTYYIHIQDTTMIIMHTRYAHLLLETETSLPYFLAH